MASFTYAVWAQCAAADLIDKLQLVFGQRGFSLESPATGMCHTWDQEGNCVQQEMDSMRHIKSEDLPLGIQWWRKDEDIFVELKIEQVVGGIVSSVRLVGLARSEEAVIAALLIEHIVPAKGDFPDDFAVFTLDAQ